MSAKHMQLAHSAPGTRSPQNSNVASLQKFSLQSASCLEGRFVTLCFECREQEAPIHVMRRIL